MGGKKECYKYVLAMFERIYLPTQKIYGPCKDVNTEE